MLNDRFGVSGLGLKLWDWFLVIERNVSLSGTLLDNLFGAVFHHAKP